MKPMKDHGRKAAVGLLLLVTAIILAVAFRESVPGMSGHPLLIAVGGLILLVLYLRAVDRHEQRCAACQQQLREDNDFVTRNGPLVREPPPDE